MGTHEDVLAELVEWFEDIAGDGGSGGVGARCLVLPVPSGWGRSTLLSRFEQHISQQGSMEARVCRIDGAKAHGSLPVQARWLCQELEEVAGGDRLRRVLGVDTPMGQFDAGVTAADAAGLIGGRPLMLASLVKTLGLNVLGLREDDETKQCLADAARVARRVSSASVRRMPVVVLIDDGEEIDEQLLDRAASEIVGPAPSRCLVVVACDPLSTQVDMLMHRERFGPAVGRFHRLDVDACMGFDERMVLVSELAPSWPPEARERLASRSRDLTTVFKALAVRGAGDVGDAPDPAPFVDRLVDSVVPPDEPTLAASVVGWCGGFVNRRVFASIVGSLGIEADAADLVAIGDLVRVRHAQMARAAESAPLALSKEDRRTIAELLVNVAAQLAIESTGPLDRIALAEPVWLLVQRKELALDGTIAALLTALALARRDVGDDSVARTVAEVVACWDVDRGAGVRSELLHLLEYSGADWIVDVPEGALTGVEAAVYRIAALLRTPSRFEDGLQMLEQTMQRLDNITASAQTDEWRLMLGHRFVRCGRPIIAAEVLQPLLSCPEGDSRRTRAEWVLRAAGDVGELHLQRAALLERWALLIEGTRVETDDELIALADAVSDLSGRLGDWRTALQFGGTLLAASDRVLGADHPDTLATRSNLAFWTAKVGNGQRALALYQELLPDRIRVLGADHPNTLATRSNIAGMTGSVESPQRALALYQELLPDQIRVLGADHPNALATRTNVAFMVGRVGNPRRALALYQELLPDQIRVLGADHPDTLTTRSNIAFWIAKAGGGQRALALYQELLPDQIRVLGADHPDTLATRGKIANQIGDPQRALALHQELLPVFARVLGADHPDTLTTRGNIANTIGQTGDPQRALTLYQELLPDRVRVLGADHPDTLTTRGRIAHMIGQTGDPQRALTLYQELLPDRVRVLGADHPDTLTTRGRIAHMIGEIGDPERALTLYQELLPDRVRVLGADHPDTLATRSNIAFWTATVAGAQPALALYQELLPDQIRVLGADHPDTLTTRGNIANMIGQTGDPQRALTLYRELLPDRIRVLGADHPDTLTTRGRIANMIGEIGDPQRALALHQELLPDRVRVLGADHPDTLTTRSNIAFWTATVAGAQPALTLYQELLPDQIRVLGADQPDTLTTRGNIAHMIGQTGDPERALALHHELLPDQIRVLGADHPDTLTTRWKAAIYLGESGRVDEAITDCERLLPDCERVLLAGDPLTNTVRESLVTLRMKRST